MFPDNLSIILRITVWIFCFVSVRQELSGERFHPRCWASAKSLEKRSSGCHGILTFSATVRLSMKTLDRCVFKRIMFFFTTLRGPRWWISHWYPATDIWRILTVALFFRAFSFHLLVVLVKLRFTYCCSWPQVMLVERRYYQFSEDFHVVNDKTFTKNELEWQHQQKCVVNATKKQNTSVKSMRRFMISNYPPHSNVSTQNTLATS